MRSSILAVTLVSLFAACGPQIDEQRQPGGVSDGPAPAAPGVTIVAPVEGAFQEEHEVEVVLRTTIPLAPAGDMSPGTAHHHLYLDADLGDMTAPIPSVPGSIVHIGDASSAYRFEEVASGPHRLIAVLADGAHVPLQPLVVDTLRFVVE